MTTPTFTQLKTLSTSGNSVPVESILERLLTAMLLAAGLNPDGTVNSLPVTSTASIPAAANVLAGFQSFSVSTAATTVITVPAGRTWVGTLAITCACLEAAAGTAAPQATGIVTTAGVGVTPAAGTYLRCDALGGSNLAGGTAGTGGNNAVATPFVVVAPGGNSVTVQAASTCVGTGTVVSVTAIGLLQ